MNVLVEYVELTLQGRTNNMIICVERTGFGRESFVSWRRHGSGRTNDIWSDKWLISGSKLLVYILCSKYKRVFSLGVSCSDGRG